MIRRFVPIVSWLPRYEKAQLSRDAIAGVTIWGLLIPEMIAYRQLTHWRRRRQQRQRSTSRIVARRRTTAAWSTSIWPAESPCV